MISYLPARCNYEKVIAGFWFGHEHPYGMCNYGKTGREDGSKRGNDPTHHMDRRVGQSILRNSLQDYL